MKVGKGFIDKTVIILVVLLVITRFTAEFFGINLVSITALGIIYLSFLLIIGNIKLYKLSESITILCVFLVFHIPITILWTDSINYGFEKIKLFLPLFTITYISSYVVVNRFSELSKYYFIIFTSIIVMVVASGAFNRILVTLMTGQRFYLEKDAINSSVTLGYFFGLSILFLARNMPLFKTKFYRLILFIAIGLSFVFLFFTGSRGPLVALFGAYLFFKILKTRKKVFYISFLVIVTLATIIFFESRLLYSVMPEYFRGFIELRYTSHKAAGSIYERIQLYKQALVGIFQGNLFEILFGHGVGDFSDLMYGQDKRLYPHNLLLEIGYEFGLLYLLSFLVINFKIILLNLKKSIDVNLKWLLIIYYYVLIRSMISGDIASNFLVYSFIIFIFTYERIRN